MVLTPGVEPDEATRRAALKGMEETWAKTEQHAKEHGVTDDEIDAAVDEAMTIR